MPSPVMHLLPWENPLAATAARWLAGEWTGEGPLDLSAELVVVPTQQAGRRLREALAEVAAMREQAVFPPRVVLPEALALPKDEEGGEGRAATRTESVLAWIEVVRRVDLATVREVLPVAPVRRDFAWALGLATELQRLQQVLAEGAWRIGDVARRATRGEGWPEATRWAELANLETAYDAGLARRGRRCAQALRQAAVMRPTWPAGVRRIVVVAVPDLLPGAVAWLRGAAELGRVEVVVFGPTEETRESWCDEWGRPLPEVWAKRPLVGIDFAGAVHLAADPAAQAERVVATVRRYAQPERRVGVGVVDAEVMPRLEQAFSEAGLAGFNPEGRRWRGTALHHLIDVWRTFVAEPTWLAGLAVLRCPAVLDWLARRGGGEFSAARLLRAADALHAEFLPATVAEAARHVAVERDGGRELAGALAAMREWRDAAGERDFPRDLQGGLGVIFGGRNFDLAAPGDAVTVAAARAWGEAASEVAAARERFPSAMRAAEAGALAWEIFGEGRYYEERPEHAVELQGWLELWWDDAPHLIVAGCNDGGLPEAVVGDAFLPEGLRERLGLKTNAVRFARDAFLLQALAAARREGGRLDLLVGKTSTAGDPLRPSRLLFLCDDAELPGRVKRLFRPMEATGEFLAWERAWRLRPRWDAPIERIPVTGFRAYLACPFRFYLRYGLKMEGVDPHKAELDALDFGRLCHGALEAMGHDAMMRDCAEPERLRGFLLEHLAATARERFGANPTLPLVVQLESARQRLGRVAEVQAAERAAGWVIEEVERPFELEIGGLKVRGTIDRIDRHVATGAVRVLDYKTTDQLTRPEDAHRGAVRSSAAQAAGPEMDWVHEGKTWRWRDLQLPLYRRALAEDYGAAIACAYFNLPKAAGDVGVYSWDNYDTAVQAAADACAEAVVAAVRARRFWPPAEMAERSDDFACLFQGGAAKSVEAPVW